jgi:hypothetical protein
MPTLRLKSRSGAISDLQCEELISVDGVPYVAGDGIGERMANLEGRVDTLFELFTQPAEAACDVSLDGAGDSTIVATMSGA